MRSALQREGDAARYVARVGRSRSRSGFWHTIRSKSEFGLGLSLGPHRSRFGSVLTSVSLELINHNDHNSKKIIF